MFTLYMQDILYPNQTEHLSDCILHHMWDISILSWFILLHFTVCGTCVMGSMYRDVGCDIMRDGGNWTLLGSQLSYFALWTPSWLIPVTITICSSTAIRPLFYAKNTCLVANQKTGVTVLWHVRMTCFWRVQAFKAPWDLVKDPRCQANNGVYDPWLQDHAALRAAYILLTTTTQGYLPALAGTIRACPPKNRERSRMVAGLMVLCYW